MRSEVHGKTAFAIHRGLVEILRMLFGLRNASSSFQRTIDVVLSGVKWRTCLVYIDDIIVFSASFEDHLRDVAGVLEILRTANAQLKPEMCQNFRHQIEFLGHEISPGSLEMPHSKSRAIAEMRQPLSQSEIRSFLGLAGVYWRYVRGFADLAVHFRIC
jgi:Reverse transcriptase (RNA-dependent DNA polymerase)